MGKTGSGKAQKSRKHGKLKPVAPEYLSLWRNGGSSEGVDRGKRNGKEKHEKRGARQVDTGINQRPRAGDEEHVPRSLKNLIHGKNLARNMKHTKKKKRKDIPEHLLPREKGMTRPLKPVTKFVQKKGESDFRFSDRMYRETQAAIKMAQFEDKFDVEVGLKNDGTVDVKKTEGKRKQKAKERLKEKKAKEKEKKMLKKFSKSTGFEVLKDDIKFGEVAMAPPSLSKKPRGAKELEMKPGRKQLLLKEIIQDNKAHRGVSSAPKTREIGKTIKRKNLSISEQRKLDLERERVVDLYRKMKAEKLEAKS